MSTTPLLSRDKTIVLLDIDGTLTEPRKAISPDTKTFLQLLRHHVTVGVVGGSDVGKAQEQLGGDYLEVVDWAFAENGLVAYRAGACVGRRSLADHWGEAALQRLINWILRYLSEVELPVKRGTFVEFRTGMINVSPVGRSCSQAERDEFEAYDRVHGVRARMVEALLAAFGEEMGLAVAVGGQISFDVFPRGWDKTYCLRYLEPLGFKEIHFFGDKTAPGGNDHEIFADPRTIGHTVAGPADTVRQCAALFGLSVEPPDYIEEAGDGMGGIDCGAGGRGGEDCGAGDYNSGSLGGGGGGGPPGGAGVGDAGGREQETEEEWRGQLDEMLEAFRAFDPVGSGTVPEDQLRTYLTTLGEEPMDAEEVDHMLAEAREKGCIDGGTGLFHYEDYVAKLR